MQTSSQHRSNLVRRGSLRLISAACLAAAVLVWLLAPHAAARGLDPLKQDLLRRLAYQPQLMNLSYLKYVLGKPENERNQRALIDKSYYWYDDSRSLTYELHQTEHFPGQISESTFVMHMADADCTFDDLQKMFGVGARRFYDYHSYPSELYSFSPDTFLIFTSPRNTFRVQEAKVSYRGHSLPKPSGLDFKLAQDHVVLRASDAVREERWEEAISLLRVRLQERPDDGEAHCLLGRAYSATGHLNEAISQYKTALALSGGNEALRGRCLTGLGQLKALPGPSEAPRREYKIVHGGQRIRAGEAHSQPASVQPQGDHPPSHSLQSQGPSPGQH